METFEMIELMEENIENQGCFCLRSKPSSTGYIDKNKWLLGSFCEDSMAILKVTNSSLRCFLSKTL